MSERMQALLSRAAEEQLNEQRQVSVVLGDLRQLLTGLSERVEALGRRIDEQAEANPSAVPDGLVALQREVSGLDDRLDVAAQRPVLTEQALDAGLSPVLSRLDALDDRLQGLADTAERLPAVATTLHDVADRVDALSGMRDELAGVKAGLSALQEESEVPSLVHTVAAMRDTVAELGGRVAKIDVPTADAVAVVVSQQVSDRLLDELAPRVADLVVNKVASTLVDQVASSVSASVQSGLADEVRTVSAESERRISAHVDDAVLALAEALLRRRRTGRGLAAPAPADLAEPDPVEPGLGGDMPDSYVPGPDMADSSDAPQSAVEAGPRSAGAEDDWPVEPPSRMPPEVDQPGGSATDSGTTEPGLPEIWPAEVDLPEIRPAEAAREAVADGNRAAKPAGTAGLPAVTDVGDPPAPVSPLRTPPGLSALRPALGPPERETPFAWEPQPPEGSDDQQTQATARPEFSVSSVDSVPSGETALRGEAAPSGEPEAGDDEWYDVDGEDGPRRRPWWRPGG